jgi:serine/threonine protein kinase
MSQTRKIARYEILEEKGRGAMGAVYVARDPAMDRIVALKTIHSGALSGPQAAEYRERFFREARAAGRLAHPGIVQMFDVGEHEGNPFLVMEFVEGLTLDATAKGGERFTLDRTCEVGQQIAEALGYAHSHGVVHRDIKPANILMTSKTKYGIERPKITDFGVAKLSATQITTTGQMLGTPAFMPPEQFTGAAIDGRSDLFSLGVILYWLSTGEQAFPGETVTAVSYKVVHTEPVPPRKLNPAIPAGLEQIISKCLMKDPEQRYQTGEELSRELAAVRAGRSSPALKTPVAIKKRDPGATAMEATLDPESPEPPLPPEQHRPTLPTVSAPKPSATARKSINPKLILVGAVVLVLIYVGHLFSHRRDEKTALSKNPSVTAAATETSQPEAMQPSSSATEAPAPAGSPLVPNSAVAAKPEVKKSKPEDADSHSASLDKKPPKREKTPPPAADSTKPSTPVGPPASAAVVVPAPAPEPPKPQPPPPPAHVEFDPKTMDPNANGKLKVDATHFPVNVNFTVEMDGKIYFERGDAKAKMTFDDLFVPPGIHEFRVFAGIGVNRRTSNTVSTEFKAKKRKTLEIELRSKGAGSGSAIPQEVYVDSQLVVNLK